MKILVDPEDEHILSEYNWSRSGNGFIAWTKGCQEKIILSHIIMGAKKEEQVDHIDHDIANNHKVNLRICTRSQNQCNRQRTWSASSKYKGLCKVGKKWKAGIRVNKKDIHLGYFPSEEDAARAYNEAAKKYHGEFAYLNKIEEII